MKELIRPESTLDRLLFTADVRKGLVSGEIEMSLVRDNDTRW
jgi:hypothetical protein